MATITDYFQQAQLSLAAYALGLQREMLGQGYPGYVPALIDAGMSDAQAKNFADTYAVVDQYNDSSTGFSATVFQNVHTGEYSLAIRGTEGLFDRDFLEDILLATG